MPENEIERLTVTLEADYASKLIPQIKEGVSQGEKELDKLSDAPKKAQSNWERFGGFLKGQFLGIITSIGAAIAVAFSVQAVTQFFSAIARGMIDTNKQFEVFETQFTTLLGSTGEAKKRIDELARFGIATPFELDEIVESNRLLQTFGGTLLATGENLRRIGDSAAGVNANFQEVSFWTGRLYSAIQAGRPFGEASARLQELGILTGDVRTKLEDMQKAGADGTEIWAAYSEMVDTRFGGAMEKLSKTLQGVMSNLADFQSMLLREGGEELFEGVRDDVIEFYDIISSPEAQEALIALAKAFGTILDTLREMVTTPFLEQLEDIDPEKVARLADALDGAADSFARLTGQGGGDTQNQALNNTIDMLSELVDIITIVNNVFTILERHTGLVSTGLNEAVKAASPLFNAIRQMYQEYQKLDAIITALTGKSIAELTGAAADLTTSMADTGAGARALAEEYAHVGTEAEHATTAVEGSGDAAEEAADQFEKAREMFEGFSKSFLDAQEEIGEKRAELEKEHGEKVNEILAEYAEDQEDIVKEAGEALLKLEQDIAQQREEIAENTAEALLKLEQDIAKQKADAIANAQEDLAGLESDTQDQISDVKEEAQEKERRATEDHQREMQRLQQNYLLNLEDAVKNRDARAIVDLRRKHQMEMREKEEDFQVKRARDREDTEKRLEEIEEAEAKKKEEIKQALEEQLQDLEETEAEKKREIEQSQAEQLQALEEAEAKKAAEIEAKRAEDLEKLEENLIEQLNKEEENYQERQAMLDEALQRKLEAVAKQLADEKEITEEGAQAVLETLNETYGAGGDIDRLMEEFIERRKQQMEALAALEQNLADQLAGPMGGGTGSPLEGGDGGGGMPLKLPTFQMGGVVPGNPGQKRLIVAHAGELIVPQDQISDWLGGQKESMSMNFDGNSTKTVIIEHRGSAPPGVGSNEVDQVAGVVVQALRDAGIFARRK